MPRKKPEVETLTRDELRMVSEFRKYRDVYKAAEKAHIAKNQAVKVFNKTAFQEELDRQDEVVRNERGKLEAEATAMTREFLDQELIGAIREEKGALKMEALRLGYVVAGVIQNGTTRSLTASIPDPDADAVPGTGATYFYQATVQGQMKQVDAEPILPPTEEAAPVAPPPSIRTPEPKPAPPSPNRAGPLSIG